MVLMSVLSSRHRYANYCGVINLSGTGIMQIIETARGERGIRGRTREKGERGGEKRE